MKVFLRGKLVNVYMDDFPAKDKERPGQFLPDKWFSRVYQIQHTLGKGIELENVSIMGQKPGVVPAGDPTLESLWQEHAAKGGVEVDVVLDVTASDDRLRMRVLRALPGFVVASPPPPPEAGKNK